jgi:hypothetical protein
LFVSFFVSLYLLLFAHIVELTLAFNAAGQNYAESRVRTKLGSAEVRNRLASLPKKSETKEIGVDSFPVFDGIICFSCCS